MIGMTLWAKYNIRAYEREFLAMRGMTLQTLLATIKTPKGGDTLLPTQALSFHPQDSDLSSLIPTSRDPN